MGPAVALAALFTAVAFSTATAQETAGAPAGKAGHAAAASAERFDELVRDDLFDGMRKGDRAAFDRAMKLCADTLAQNPRHAPAMVWHGTGLIYESGQAFQSKDIPKGLDLWQRGLKEMNDAVALNPDDVGILIPRGAVLLPVSKYDPNPEEARQLIRTGVADYEKVLHLQEAYFPTLSVHARGELLFGLADGWFRLDEMNKSRDYLQRIVKDLAGSEYATLATAWLQTAEATALQKRSAALSCIGCHAR